jgi:hypothetical protein
MDFLAYILLIAFLLGSGTLVASIIPTRGARIGLGAVVFLALIVDGTWLLAPLVDWSPALGDAVWIGVFALIVLGAAMTAGYYRGTTGKPAWAWPSTRDVLFMIVVITLFGAAVLVLPVPLDTDAQGFGYLALTLREGKDYTTLAPWHPEIDYLYSPGYIGLIAYLSARFDLGIHTLQLIFSAATAVLFVWTAYDLGNELEGPRTGRGLMLAAVIGTGLITAFMDSHFTALLALLFSLGFITFVLRFLDKWRWSSVLFAAICLAGVPLSQPDTTIALIIGYAPWLVVIWLSKPRPSFRAWLILVSVIPSVALGIILPWLASIRDLLGSDIESPFQVEFSHWRTMVLMHGGIVVVLATVGLLVGVRKRHPAHWLMIVWLVGIVEFSTLGLLEKTFPDLLEPLLKYDYPFSLAWHGPIIPYTLLGGTALVWLADQLGGQRLDRLVGWLAIPVLVLALAGLVAGVVFFDDILATSKDHADFYGAFSSAADTDAMTWIREHTPQDTRVLNHPGPHEGDWGPDITERDTVYFRPQPFFSNTEQVEAEQEVFRAFWNDPADPAQADRLRQAGVRYVLVPQVFGNPDSFMDMLRWRQPLPEARSYLKTPINQAPYLQLVYDKNGARVYEVAAP